MHANEMSATCAVETSGRRRARCCRDAANVDVDVDVDVDGGGEEDRTRVETTRDRVGDATSAGGDGDNAYAVERRPGRALLSDFGYNNSDSDLTTTTLIPTSATTTLIPTSATTTLIPTTLLTTTLGPPKPTRAPRMN